jgi:HSP20 family protein
MPRLANRRPRGHRIGIGCNGLDAAYRRFGKFRTRARTPALRRLNMCACRRLQTVQPVVPAGFWTERSVDMNELRVNEPFALESMDDMLRRMFRPWRAELSERAPQIKLDVHENETSYTVKAEVPGVSKDDIDVRIVGNQVTISAELKKEHEEKKDGRLLHAERQYGYASRAFSLASEVDESKSSASYQNGILELTLPKKTKTSSTRLPIG